MLWVVVVCMGVVGIREEKALHRATGSCQGVSRMGEKGGAVARCLMLLKVARVGVACFELPRRSIGGGGAIESCLGLPKGGRGDGEEIFFGRSMLAAAEWQGCDGF
jgi:hypothetical protein